MLSSIVSSFSPKKLLAASISKSLAQFFHVDPDLVETNLVQNAKVTLKGIEIKQRRLGGLLVHGSVGQIEFSWTWDTASFITDAVLTIQGVDIHVRLINVNDPTDDIDPSVELSSQDASYPNVDVAQGSDADWKARYKQQIIDHLTVLITDVLVSIKLTDGSQVVLEARDMELQSLQKVEDGTDESSSLLQQISLGSVASWIQDSNSTKHAILDPFGYHASVQRISGRRFLDGVLSGLMVQGKSWAEIDAAHAGSTIRVHAGKSQLAGLNCLQQVLQSMADDKSTPIDEERKKETSAAEKRAIEKTSHPATSSIFRLPFRSVEIVLEDNVKLGLEGCEVKYCMDGTEVALHCNGGLWMDSAPILKNGDVVFDFANSKLVLDVVQRGDSAEGEAFYNAQSSIMSDSSNEAESVQTPNKENYVEFSFSIDLFQRLYRSVSALLPQCQEAVASAEQRRESKPQVESKPLASVPWTVVSKNVTSFRFEGNDNSWIRVTGTGLSVCKSQTKDVPVV